MNSSFETLQMMTASAQKEMISCRLCGNSLSSPFLDLGQQPLCDSYLRQNELNQMEPFFPLQVYVCRGQSVVVLSFQPPRECPAQASRALPKRERFGLFRVAELLLD